MLVYSLFLKLSVLDYESGFSGSFIRSLVSELHLLWRRLGQILQRGTFELRLQRSAQEPRYGRRSEYNRNSQ